MWWFSLFVLNTFFAALNIGVYHAHSANLVVGVFNAAAAVYSFHRWETA